MLKLLPFLFLAPLAKADVYSSTAWAQATQGNMLVEFHLDDQTGVFSVHADYSGLNGHLVEVRLEDGAGNLWLSVPHNGGQEGSVSGNVVLTPTQIREALTPQGRIVFYTTATPSDEIVADINLTPRYWDQFQINGDQIVDGTGESSFTALGHLEIENGQAEVRGYTTNIESRVTSMELRGPAWFGETGPLIAEFSTIDQIGYSVTFSHLLSAPSPQLLNDMRDGLVYVLVKTDVTPTGAARGQASDGRLGQEFCPANLAAEGPILPWLSLEGSPRLADNDLTFVGSVPRNKPVLPLVGLGTLVSKPAGSRGFLCLGGGPIARMTSEFGFSDSSGVFTASPDLSRLSLPGIPPLQPGDSLTFQLWYRDSGPVQSSNFTNAVWVRFR